MKLLSQKLLLALFVPLCLIAQSSAKSNRPAKTPNNRYTLSHPQSSRSWTVGGSQVTASQVSQSAETSLERELSQKGFLRVQSLDVQCCIVQFEAMDVAEHNTEVELNARVTVFDIDRQSLYTKEFRAAANRGQMKAATDQLVSQILTDDRFLKLLAGK